MLRVLFSALGLLAGCSVTSFSVVLFLQGSVGVRLAAHRDVGPHQPCIVSTTHRDSFTASQVRGVTRQVIKPILLNNNYHKDWYEIHFDTNSAQTIATRNAVIDEIARTNIPVAGNHFLIKYNEFEALSLLKNPQLKVFKESWA